MVIFRKSHFSTNRALKKVLNIIMTILSKYSKNQINNQKKEKWREVMLQLILHLVFLNILHH